jgi:O-antigen/teichoic acid export membrane protein
MNALISWLKRERNSTRIAFLLQMVSRLASAALAFLWARLLFQAMGAELNGLWVGFIGVASLGGLGDLGMGGAVGIRVGRLLGQNDEKALREFLASARTLFLVLTLTVSGLFAISSFWLPRWLGFETLTYAGSMPLLFAVAAAGSISLIWNSYIGNVNYACGNLVWPILPIFLLTQIAFVVQWLLARQHIPLWAQYSAFVISGGLSLALTWWFVRISHPSLSRFLPLRMNWVEWRILAGQTFWMYFWGLGCYVYTNVDRLLIIKGFGPAEVPRYHNNYKVCELALFAISAASMAAMPKITRWLASRETDERARGIAELVRLNRFQIVLSCAGALVYLAVIDFVIGFQFAGVGDLRVPLSWQFAFALSLAVTGAGDAAVQVSPRCCDRGLRVSGIAVAVTALINVVLSFAAMRAGSILGIALATVLAQSFFSLWISRFVCGELKLSWRRWALRSWLLPVGIVSCAYAARSVLAWNIGWQATALVMVNLVLLGILRSAR